MLELPINLIGDVGANDLAVSFKLCTKLHTVIIIELVTCPLIVAFYILVHKSMR